MCAIASTTSPVDSRENSVSEISLQHKKLLVSGGERDVSCPAEINIVVTGFSTWGPYAPLLDLTINTSWFIATLLPKFIFRTGEPDIRVLTYPKAFKTSWETAEPVVPTLWKGNKADYGLNMEPDQPNTFNIDAMVLLGMDDDDDSRFSFEKKAYRGQFENRDFVNKAPSQADLTGNGTWALAPEVIETDLDVYGIYRQVKSEMKACPRYAVMDCS